MVWDFKAQEGNSHGPGKEMFAGPFLTTGHRERTLIAGPCGRFLPIYCTLVYIKL